ncbi:uncharacterized protein A1O5_07537 [Cladophialophora psammophila CBS 110553]|uniref:Srp40 C-terminal domain-containing protein n=1 Tax=Cladophialophora psammophila CBS 110553 TaxID=1182543 RepID=W9WXX4_9EURO|nr:uncharacterized protein A1O5_07537 [Cladophialophora psammophila CBS 110553]EXJ69501.1 hypothetical protein A1O5_07537 [Cladophialophora psammophila CBS 110553]
MKATTTEPSSQVLSLVSSFLADHGFHSTIKTLKKELKRMNQSVEVLALGDSQDGANLQDIVENWNKQELLQPSQSTSDGSTSDQSEGTTSESVSESSSASSGEESDAGANSELSTPESESESGSGTDEEKVNTKQRSKAKRVKVNKRETSPSTSSSASSDSDADDERETSAKAKPKATRKKSPTTSKVAGPVRILKRKASSSSSESSSSDSDSDSDSDSSEDDRPAKRAKIDANDDTDKTSSSEMSSSSSAEESDDAGDSSVEEEEEDQARPDGVTEPMSDSSSGTVTGDVIEPARSEPEVLANKSDKQSVATKKKHVGARPTPLAQLSAQATPDSHISNAYRSYDYADRAYNDLSVTRGKGFTKEKNKKKRGSYRGGAIDISGGKSFKFDD